jgi:hypothetical protein
VNVEVWRGWCNRCGEPSNEDTMYLLADLSEPDHPKLELVCMNALHCSERAAAKRAAS